MKFLYFISLLGLLSLCSSCDISGDDDAATDADSDTDTDTDTDTDSDSDADTDPQAPADKWTFVFPVIDSIQESSDLPLALGEDGTIYAVATPFGNGAKLYAIDPDGQQKWVNTDLPTAWSDDCGMPIVSDGTDTIYVVCMISDSVDIFDRVYAISTAGNLKWSEDFPATGVLLRSAALSWYGSPVVDSLYLATSGSGLTRTVYSIDSSGSWGPSFEQEYLDDGGLHGFLGIAIDSTRNVLVRTVDGELFKLTPDLSVIWEHALPPEPGGETFISLSIGADDTVYASTSAPSLIAVDEDGLGNPYNKWVRSSAVMSSEPSFGEDGTLYVHDSGTAAVAISPEDGSEIWSQNMYHGIIPAITALEDGTTLIGLNQNHGGYDPSGEFLWYLGSMGMHSPALADDGTIYVTGQHETNITNAVFAYQGFSAIASGWSRGNRDNGNTRWAR